VSREQQESGEQTLVIFALGLLLVFLVLAAQYESFVLPFVVVLSVPLAVLGAATRTRRSRTRAEPQAAWAQ
jgi:HAE1 family hydrophobic/amphiphilic exporter-1